MATKLMTRSAELTRAAGPSNPQIGTPPAGQSAPANPTAGAVAAPSPGVPAGAVTAPATETRAAVNAQIRSLADDMQLGTEFSNGLIDRNATIDEARAAALDALRSRSQAPIQTQRIQIGVSHDDPELRCRHMGEAIYARIDPSHQLSEPARGYAHNALSDLAREALRLRGISVTGLSKAELVTRSLHTTSDFSVILGDAVGRTLRKAYLAAPAGIKKVARQTTAPDFRSRQKIMLGEAPTLKKVNEHGEFTSGSMAEAKEAYKLDTFGRIIGISRQAIINDDLGAFADLAARFGQAAASFEAVTLVSLLALNAGAGPTMDDTKALFHADHKNLAGAGAVISETTLSAGRLALRKQTGLSGDLIDVTPKYLLVPPDQETKGEKELAAIAAAKTSDVNAFASKLELVVENRLASTTRWYITADPALSDGLEYAYLEGQPGPQIETKNGFEVDGVQVKVREDFGCGFIDFRSWYSNPGA